jgi:hypothetical protein
MMNRWKRKDYGTGSIRQLLEAKSGQFSSLDSFSSKRSLKRKSELSDKEERVEQPGKPKDNDEFDFDDDEEIS